MGPLEAKDPKLTQSALLGKIKQTQKVRKIPVFDVNTGYFYGESEQNRCHPFLRKKGGFSAVYQTFLLFFFANVAPQDLTNPHCGFLE